MLAAAGCSSSGQIGAARPSAAQNAAASTATSTSTSTATPTSPNANASPAVDVSASGTLTVWLEEPAQATWPDAVRLAANKFDQAYPNVKITVAFQNWSSGYAAKAEAAIQSTTPPDVVELGTTETGGIISQGSLSDITADKATFDNSSTWQDVLAQSCTSNGKLFCVPYYAAKHDGVIVGGSDLAIPATSQHRLWAEAWIKAFTSDATEQMFAQKGSGAPGGFTYLANTTSIP
ncbi:extracellular solute-binding protein [Catenulispora pinisilvae]|uniref:extracellular solute-binding protein n=1 Tax=Catenulispora pinisilvae TaxID=2705253 RepID=UPI002B27A9EE|nr:extracellular solute-binding protein [Catenulispora pinisilvae]